MDRVLRGQRYLRRGNERLARFILEDLPYLDFQETYAFYKQFTRQKPKNNDLALLGCNDRFFLFTGILNRRDGLHPWIFARCREVEADPNGYLDLWARYHYKSSLITFAGNIQEVVCDPEITIGILSFNNATAARFVNQIKRECEDNTSLKMIYPDVMWWNPKSDSPSWTERSLIFKRRSNPQVPTIGGHGIIDTMPTGSHYAILNYDDVITEKHVTNEDMVKKVNERFELTIPLGIGLHTQRRATGTRYSFADSYGVLLKRQTFVPRLFPATDNGRADGKPVFMSVEELRQTLRDMPTTFAAQMLQNPAEGKESTFTMSLVRGYEVRPTLLNVYIMGDPSKGKTKTSDNTAIAVVGVDVNENKYLLDGVRHRMSLSRRWEWLSLLWKKWKNAPGVQSVNVGWEQYGLTSDIEHFESEMKRSKGKISFSIQEIAWVREGNQSKGDRIERLLPDVNSSKFLFPAIVFDPAVGENCQWSYNEDDSIFDTSPLRGKTRLQRQMEERDQPYRIQKPIKRKDQDGNVYDLTLACFEEMRFEPFGEYRDFIDALSRVYDMEPTAPMPISRQTAEVPDHPDT